MNFQIPRWAHVAIVLVLAVIGAVTALASKGDVQIAGPILSLLAIVASLLHSVDPAAAAKIAAKASAVAVFMLAGAMVSGCLSVAPLVPETPANQAQIQTCQNTATLHNDFVIGDMVMGVGTTTVSSIAALAQDTTTKNDLAITGAILGGLGAAGVLVAGLTAASFTNNRCTDVVGPLPAKRITQ